MLNFNTKSICLSLSQKLKLNKYNPKTTLHSPTTTTTTTTTQQWRVSAHLLVLAFATNLIVRSSCLVSLSLSILIAIVLALGLDLLASSARLQLCFQHACILQGFNSFVHCFTFHQFFVFVSIIIIIHSHSKSDPHTLSTYHNHITIVGQKK